MPFYTFKVTKTVNSVYEVQLSYANVAHSYSYNTLTAPLNLWHTYAYVDRTAKIAMFSKMQLHDGKQHMTTCCT